MLDTVEIDERISKCERILKENPDSQIFAALSDALRKKGDLDLAFRTCMQGLRLHPDYGPGRLVMAKINFDRKMFDWAERELTRAIELDGRSRATDILEIEILIKRDFFSKAKVILDKLRTADPRNPYYHDLASQIDRGKAAKQAKLAKVDELYRSSKHGDNPAAEVPSVADLGRDEPLTFDVALDMISDFAGVLGCYYVNHQGMVDQSRVPDGFNLEPHAAEMMEIVRGAGISLEEGEFGAPHALLIENENGKIQLLTLDSRVMVIVGSDNVNLGSLRLRLISIAGRLGKEWS